MIALDGADSRLLDAWSLDGTLPALSALRTRGTARRLSAPAGITDDGIWACFQYSTGLGEHGRYHHRQRRNDGTWGLAVADEAEMPRFWDRLSAAGPRVAILDVPKCAPPRPLNGIHLADWEVHGRYSHVPQSFPPALAAEVVERFGAAPPSRCHHTLAALPDDEVRELVGNLERGIAQKRAAALYYLEREDWDVFVVGFKEAHCAGHALWDLADEGHPGHDEARNAALGRPIQRIMQVLDAAVGDLIDAAGPGVDVVVFATTEIVPNGSVGHLMDEVVQRLNVALGNRGLIRRLKLLFKLPPPVELLPYNENCAALRLHTGGDTAERAIAMLRELTVPASGEKVFDRIDLPSRTEAGARAGRLPDILLHFRPGLTPDVIESARLGRFVSRHPPLRPGNHAPGLFAISAGPRVVLDGGPRSLEDFGPLIGRLLAR